MTVATLAHLKWPRRQRKANFSRFDCRISCRSSLHPGRASTPPDNGEGDDSLCTASDRINSSVILACNFRHYSSLSGSSASPSVRQTEPVRLFGRSHLERNPLDARTHGALCHWNSSTFSGIAAFDAETRSPADARSPCRTISIVSAVGVWRSRMKTRCHAQQ